MEQNARERLPREFHRAEQVGIGGELFLVGRDNFGRQQTAVGQDERPSPALLRALSPANQIGRRHGPLLLAGCGK